MPFAYFDNLAPRQRAIYRQSDGVGELPLPRAAELAPEVEAIRAGLEEDDRHGLTLACQRLCDGIGERLGVPPVTVRVLAARPSRDWGELHGLYEPPEDGVPARLTVWMRTAQRRQVVAFRTFLRTVLHELCHHLDYEHLRLADSFHTEGFFRRESHLLRQLLPPAAG